jgi:transposase
VHAPAGVCKACGGTELRTVGENVTEVLEYIPGRFEVVRHVRPACSCRKCETMVQAPMPELPIPRGMAGASFLAHIATSKFCDHLPLYRQAEIPITARLCASSPYTPGGLPLHARPRLDELATWLDAQLQRIPGKSELAGAIRYARSRWGALTCYLDHGWLEISNNAAENATRPVALGRKNWLFAGSDSGGERAALFYTLVCTAKLNGVEPETYLREVITRIGAHPVNRLA